MGAGGFEPPALAVRRVSAVAGHGWASPHGQLTSHARGWTGLIRTPRSKERQTASARHTTKPARPPHTAQRVRQRVPQQRNSSIACALSFRSVRALTRRWRRSALASWAASKLLSARLQFRFGSSVSVSAPWLLLEGLRLPAGRRSAVGLLGFRAGLVLPVRLVIGRGGAGSFSGLS